MNKILSGTMPAFRKPEGPERQMPVRIDGRQTTVPGLIASAGKNTGWRFLEFFAVTIRNRNNRK